MPRLDETTRPARWAGVPAADRVAELLVAFGGGTVETGVTVVGEAPDRVTITMDADLPERITGMPIDATTSAAYLRAVGCAVTEEDGRLHAVCVWDQRSCDVHTYAGPEHVHSAQSTPARAAQSVR